MTPAVPHNRVFLPLLVALIVLAWLTLLAWDVSPYARYLHHDTLEEIRLSHDWPLVSLLLIGWTTMMFAMMLPTSLPLITLFRRMTARRDDHTRLVLLLIAGYLGVWTLFGVVVHLFDFGVHWSVDSSDVLERNEWMIGVGTLVLAGAYQFSSLKYRCLDQCRSPLSFIAGHWSGRAPSRQAFRLGIDHGLFCLGCCWSLMLVMFAVGAGNLGWMFLLGAVMAIEKNVSWGRRFSQPLGFSLLAFAAVVALNSVTI